MPIWFNWGKIPYYSTPSHSWISDYHPDLDKFTAVVPTNAGLYPPVNSGTGQWYSETMEQFFARRHKRDQAVKAKETPLERQKRLSREQAQQSRPYPGKKGPAVFCWDDVNGFRIRTPIPRQKVENIWNNWSNSQKIYNAIDNCWDCCVIFAINSLPGEPDSSDTDSDSDLDLPCVCISPQPPPAPNSRDFEPAGVNTDGADPRPPPASGILSSPASRGADCVNIQPPPASDNRDLPISRNADGMDPQPPPAPENRTPSILVDSMDTNDTSHLEKAAEQATNEQQPVLPATHFFYQADREASPAGRNVDGMDPQPASTPDNRTPSSDVPAWPGSHRPWSAWLGLGQARPGQVLGLGWPLAQAWGFVSQRPWLRPWLGLLLKIIYYNHNCADFSMKYHRSQVRTYDNKVNSPYFDAMTSVQSFLLYYIHFYY